MTIQDHLNYCTAYMVEPKKLSEYLKQNKTEIIPHEVSEKILAFDKRYQKYLTALQKPID